MNSSSILNASVNVRACRAKSAPQANSAIRVALAGFRRAAILAGALALVAPLAVFAQSNAAPARITAQISESSLTTLRGNTHPLARPQYDQGAVADSLPLHRMLLLLQRSPEQEAALRTLIDQQQSKTSPNFHQWLTPQQFGQQYGPAPADIQTVSNWLQSHGFQIARVSTGGTVIEFSGTAGQVRNAFHTEIHKYLVNGEQHFANNSDPQIPTALAPVVAGTVSLHNFPRKAQSRNMGVFTKDVKTGKVTPQYTFGCKNAAGNAATCNALGPGDFANIYNVQKLWNPGIGGHVIDGTGQTIAILGDSEICTASSPDFGASYIGPLGNSVTCSSDDVATFRSLFNLPPNAPNVILDGPDPGFNSDEIEGDLDVQWAGAVAKGATIDFVIAEGTETTAGTDLAAEYVVDNNLAPVVTESFGQCESSLGNNNAYFEALLWEQAAAQGITAIVSAGDNGSAGCDDPNTQNVAVSGAAVNGIASTPFNVAAGGTDFDVTAANYQSTYWSAAPGATVGGIPDVSALSYIPETTWNDSCAQNSTGAITGCSPTNGGIAAGSGGASNCAAQDSTGACYYYPKPSWQTVASGSGLNAGTDLARDLPDVSLFSAGGYVSNSFYVICEQDQDVNDAACTLSTSGSFGFVGVGGTSAAAPTFAGMMALVNQNIAVNNPSVSGRQGNANYVLYNLAAKQNAAATSGGYSCNSSTGPNSACIFNDVTKGNNSVPCAGGSPGCSNTSSAAGVYGVEESYNVNTGALGNNLAWKTGPGLDLATGLGSVNAFNLVSNWPTAGPFTPTTTTLCLSLATSTLASCATPINITHGTKVYVNMQVNAGANPIPVSETLPTATGTDPFVPNVVEDVALIGTFPAGNPSCSVLGCNTGGVDHFTSNSYAISNSDIYPLTSGTTVGQNYFTQGLVGGTYNVVAHYSGDGTYGSSFSTTPISVTVTPEATTASPCVMVLNPFSGAVEGQVLESVSTAGALTYSCSSASSAYYGDMILLRADVFGSVSGMESASGTVTLADTLTPGGVVNPDGVLASSYPLNTEGYSEDQTTFLAVGTHSISVQYNGDASYNAMTSPSAALSFTVAAAPTTTQITAPTNGVTIGTGASVTLTAFVDTAYSTAVNFSGGSLGNPPTGTVNFVSSITGLPINTSPIAVTPTTDSAGYVAATASYTFNPSATLTVTAVYTPASGVGNYVTSCAGASPCSFPGVVINVGTAGINVTPGCNSSTISIGAAGQSGTCLITVAGLNGFSGSVTLTCGIGGGPSGAVNVPGCSFGAPDSNFTGSGNTGTFTLTSGSPTGTATLTINTTAASRLFAPGSRPHGPNWLLIAEIGAAFACMFLLTIASKERRGMVTLAAVLFIVMAAATGCSGGGSSSGGGGTGGGNPGTTLGAYTFNVTATPSGGTAQTSQITVNVN